ncbi:MAG: MBL fold metallo-hydrolase [Alphaproteobacteria bacterium]|nr:MBL fold metallo-hydrolase [Alphaproteobacteria bacterium]
MKDFIVSTIPVTPYKQNCIILFDKKKQKGVVVDPGGDLPLILSTLGKDASRIERIVLTHGHFDHAGGAAELARTLGVEIIGPHRDDLFLLESITSQSSFFGITGMENCNPDRFLKDGEKIELAGLSFEVSHCPGHTPGHVVFINRDIGFAILGDVLFRETVGRSDFPYSDYQTLMTSIKTKLLSLDDKVEFICGHGFPSSTIGHERANNPFILEFLASVQ